MLIAQSRQSLRLGCMVAVVLGFVDGMYKHIAEETIW